MEKSYIDTPNHFGILKTSLFFFTSKVDMRMFCFNGIQGVLMPLWTKHHLLIFQNKTMQMMYETIYNALLDVGLEEAHSPQDYLNFFCLGTREDISGEDSLKDDWLFDYSPEVKRSSL